MMKAKIMFEIDWWSNDNQEYDISISSCGMVDGDSMPMDIYIKILFALSKLQKEHNDSHEKPSVFLPTEISFSGPPPVKITTFGELVEMMGNVPKDLIKKYYDNMASKIPPPPLAENSSNNEQDEKSLH